YASLAFVAKFWTALRPRLEACEAQCVRNGSNDVRTLPQQPIGPDALRRIDGTRNSGDVPAELQCVVRCDERAAPLGRFDDDRQRREAGDDAVALRERASAGVRPRSEFGKDKPTRRDLLMQGDVSARIRHVGAGSEDGNRPASGPKRRDV